MWQWKKNFISLNMTNSVCTALGVSLPLPTPPVFIAPSWSLILSWSFIWALLGCFELRNMFCFKFWKGSLFFHQYGNKCHLSGMTSSQDWWAVLEVLKTSGEYPIFRSQAETVEKVSWWEKRGVHIYRVHQYRFIRFLVYTFKCQLFVFMGLFLRGRHGMSVPRKVWLYCTELGLAHG